MKILYITYDGLTDFIGQSQVLPYLAGCARAEHEIIVISFEKPDRMTKLGNRVRADCAAAGIGWRPQRFRSFPPYLAKAIDQLAMASAARRAVVEAAGNGRPFDLLHCRSYPAAVVGLGLKRRFGLRLLFDMRGFWPDQRREGGRWNDDRLIGRTLYRRWKEHEAALVHAADHIVTLTRAARDEVARWPSHAGAPVSIIPCCADFTLFAPPTPDQRMAARRELGLDADAPVLAYLGSFGTVYLADQHMRLFDAIRRIDPASRMLVIGRDNKQAVLAEARRHGIALAEDEVRTVQSERDRVSYWLGAADVATCFITPTYSSLGVSPTKLGEYLACGLPVIGNAKVGDVGSILAAIAGGHLMEQFEPADHRLAAEQFFRLRGTNRAALRERARPLLDLPRAIAAYARIYDDPRSAVALETG